MTTYKTQATQHSKKELTLRDIDELADLIYDGIDLLQSDYFLLSNFLNDREILENRKGFFNKCRILFRMKLSRHGPPISVFHFQTVYLNAVVYIHRVHVLKELKKKRDLLSSKSRVVNSSHKSH